MFDPKQLDELTQGLFNLLPDGAKQIPQDIKKNMRALLQSSFSRMDLVTREEFDVQSAVLARTRVKLDEMQKQIEQLEASLLDKK